VYNILFLYLVNDNLATGASLNGVHVLQAFNEKTTHEK